MKSTEYMRGLLYAESERKRLEGDGCIKDEIDIKLLKIYKWSEDSVWLQGFDDYRNAYLKGKIV